MTPVAVQVLVLTLLSGRSARASDGANSETADEGQFPYIVLLELSAAASCTGSLLSSSWSLTTASCVAGDKEHPDRITLRAGLVSLGLVGRQEDEDEEYDRQRRTAVKVVTHQRFSDNKGSSAEEEEYDPQRRTAVKVVTHQRFSDNKGSSADIALVRSQPFKLDEYVQIVRLRPVSSWSGGGCIVVGFEGGTSPEGSSYQELRWMEASRRKLCFNPRCVPSSAAELTPSGAGVYVCQGSLVGLITAHHVSTGTDVVLRTTLFVPWIHAVIPELGGSTFKFDQEGDDDDDDDDSSTRLSSDLLCRLVQFLLMLHLCL